MPETIQWSPGNKDHFLVTWKNDVFVFSVHMESAGSNHVRNVFYIGRNNVMGLKILGVWRNPTFPQCVCWIPALKDRSMLEACSEYLIAVTTTGGQIRFLSISGSGSAEDRFSLHNKQLAHKYSDLSLFLAWNPWKCNLLAQGVEKTRSTRDPCILIWDVLGSPEENRSTSAPTNAADQNDEPVISPTAKISLVYTTFSGDDSGDLKDPVICNKSVCEFGTQETVSSFAWLSKSSFITGMSGNSLKVYDLSDPTKPCQFASTRAVYGLAVDPFSNARLASFVECQVSIWKLDDLEKPVYTFRESSEVRQIGWSPIRECWLGVLTAGAVGIKLYDTHPMFLQDVEESEQAPLERMAYPSGRSTTPLISFTWHPSIPTRLLSLDQEGCLDVVEVLERIALSWSPAHSILWTYGSHWTCYTSSGLMHSSRFQAGTEGSPSTITPPDFTATDIAMVMQHRAELKYGITTDYATNISLTSENKHLQAMWTWIKHAQDSPVEWFTRFRAPESDTTRPTGHSESSVRSRTTLRWAGALAYLSGEFSPSGSLTTSESNPEPDWQGTDSRLSFPRYESLERTHVLRMTMWRLNDPEDVQRRVFDSVCSAGEHGRAAMMALFNLKFNWALRFLNRASSDLLYKPESLKDPHTASLASQEIGLVSLALSGYTDLTNELWRTTCRNLLSQLTNPYLRAMFTFLTRQGKDFEPILSNTELRLTDRLAFACLYLDDTELLTYVRSTAEQLVSAGNLEAILLTGLTSPLLISLLQNYVDVSGDVQTTAVVGLLACQTCLTLTSASSALEETPHHQQTSGEHGIRTPGRSSHVGKPVPPLIKLGALRLITWIHSYRDLLDRWRMWFVRADFDVANKVPLILDYICGGTVLKLSLKDNQSLDDSMASITSRVLQLDSGSSYRSGTKLRSAGAVNQIFAACGFCGWRLGPQNRPTRVSTTITDSEPGDTTSEVITTTSPKGLQMHGGGGKQTICQRCLKPLPRCSICLMHLGTAALPITESSVLLTPARETTVRRSIVAAVPPLSNSMSSVLRLSIMGPNVNDLSGSVDAAKKSHVSPKPRHQIPSSMASLFIWCLACRHGGHASHLIEWFFTSNSSVDNESQSFCPVSGCQCRCSSLDTLHPIRSPSQPSLSRSHLSAAASDAQDGGSDSNSPSDHEGVVDPIGLDDIILHGACASSPTQTVPNLQQSLTK